MSWKSFAGSLAGIAGGAIGAVFGKPEAGYAIGSSLGNDIATNYANKQDIKNTYELLKYQNEYNSPKNQMARYAEANLNPNLIYGQNNYSASASIPSSKVSRADSLALYNMELQNKLLGSQITQNNAKTESIEQDNKLTADRIRFMKEWGVDPESFTGRIPAFFIRAGERFGNFLASHIPASESMSERMNRIKSKGVVHSDGEGGYYVNKYNPTTGRFERRSVENLNLW